MVVRHTTQQVNDYYERIGINQSSLKVILNDGIESFVVQQNNLVAQDDLYYEEKKHFIIGSAVDCILTHGEDVFKDRYHSSTLSKKPGDKAMSVIKLAYDKAIVDFPLGVDIDMALYKKQIFEACNEQAYYMNRAKETPEEDNRIASLIKDNGQAYWADLYMAEGKQVLSDEESSVINSVVISLKTHKHTSHLFKDSKDIDIVYQFPMFWNYKDVDCKGMVDIIIINHAKKRIMLIDIKTIGDYVLKFNKAIRKRRYDIQGSFYTYGIKQCLTSLSDLLKTPIDYSYTVANFAFIAESTIKPGCPLVYVLDEQLMKCGEEGNEEQGLKGWKYAIDLFKEWQLVDFSIEKKLTNTNGVLFVDNNFEYNVNV